MYRIRVTGIAFFALHPADDLREIGPHQISRTGLAETVADQPLSHCGAAVGGNSPRELNQLSCIGEAGTEHEGHLDIVMRIGRRRVRIGNRG